MKPGLLLQNVLKSPGEGHYVVTQWNRIKTQLGFRIRRENEAYTDSLRLLMLALIMIVVFHGGLLPFTHENTYDAFIHMFFGDSYYRSWFDPWEPRWYTGFATTSYPPGTHMAQGLLMYIMPLRAAFCLVFLAGC